MSDTQTKEPNWLERMHSLLVWKVSYPEANNPFSKPLSDKILHELGTNKQVLLKQLELRGTMDGEEIIKIKDLSTMSVYTDHPYLSKMPKPDIRQYLTDFGILGNIEKEIVLVQKGYLKEIEDRKAKATAKVKV